jgi:deazaflavin-dependent oxidoreductase (nitroreductase family)
MSAMADGQNDQAATTNVGGQPHLPPRWFVIAFWHTHRALLRMTRGRLGLWKPRQNRWGALWLTTVGRRSGRRREVVLGYLEDGQNLVTMAMNGWGAGEPAWWLNLQAEPDATVRTSEGVRQVHAHRAQGVERQRLWAQWAAIDKNLDTYAALRPVETAVVVLEPAGSAGSAADHQ